MNGPRAKVIINGLRESYHRDTLGLKKAFRRSIGIISANGNKDIYFVLRKVL